MGMPEITVWTRDGALAAIAQRGYLNRFMVSDDWYVAHSVPGGQAEDCPVIDDDVARDLIGDGAVEEVGRMFLLDGPGWVAWYRIVEQARDAESETTGTV